MTNDEFGSRVGCHPSFASYLKRGLRMPGTDLFIEIILTFELDPVEAIDAYRAGPEGYSAYLRNTVFRYRRTMSESEDESGTAGTEADQVG